MPIKKLENNWRDLAPQDDKINTLYYDNINFMVINKINELIEELNDLKNRYEDFLRPKSNFDIMKAISEETIQKIKEMKKCQ